MTVYRWFIHYRCNTKRGTCTQIYRAVGSTYTSVQKDTSYDTPQQIRHLYL